MKSQSALEFLTIVAVGLIILVISSAIGYDYINSYVSSSNTIKARQTTNSIISAANLVYSQGVGAQTRVAVTFPSGLIRNRTYISNKEVNLRFEEFGVRDAFTSSKIEISGTLPLVQGSTYIYARMTAKGPVLFMDSETALITVELFNDSARNNQDVSFSTGDTVYYTVNIYDFDGNPIIRDIDIQVYKEDMSATNYYSSATGSSILGQFTILESGDNGYWLFSAMDEELKTVGTKLFNKS
ncbi:MAG TPA: hypothetical protein ENN30_02345 [Candidatus Woesearchaeota archaeon]|mgnify:CR=1 FL=1|nr:hypothetical protein [Candidatus Woesearchaeota archaeon]